VPGASGDLSSRSSSGGSAQRNSPLGLVLQAQKHVAEVSSLLNGGGAAMLHEGVQTNFQALPLEARGLAEQTARLVGLIPDATPPGAAVPFSTLTKDLDALAATATQLVEDTTLNMATALGQDRDQRRLMLEPRVQELKEAGKAAKAALARMPVAELRAHKEVVDSVKGVSTPIVKGKLAAWQGATETLHEQMKAQFGATDPITLAALEARTEASATSLSTLWRMAKANVGEIVFNHTVGPIVGTLGWLFGMGGQA